MNDLFITAFAAGVLSTSVLFMFLIRRISTPSQGYKTEMAAFQSSILSEWQARNYYASRDAISLAKIAETLDEKLNNISERLDYINESMPSANRIAEFADELKEIHYSLEGIRDNVGQN